MILRYMILLLFFNFIPNGNTDYAEKYIKTYKQVAISEMKRTGVPASITLAQGMLESDFGRGKLALNANNHFGMKCGSTWQGESFLKHDDNVDMNGNRIASCFRVYTSAKESYVAHSDFLTDPRKEKRYGFLFELESDDYVGWAMGLQKSGYATDNLYSKKLIAIIENFELYNYDKKVLVAKHAKNYTSKINKSKNGKTFSKKEKLARSKKRLFENNNYTIDEKENVISKRFGKKCIIAKEGDTPLILAEKYHIYIERLLSYNRGIDNDYVFNKGDIVYLDYKKNAYYGDKVHHKVKKGETMFTIAQMYGIKLRDLYLKNKMPNKSIPLEGERVILRRINIFHKSPKYRMEDENVEVFLFDKK